jgi:hypothetical protein
MLKMPPEQGDVVLSGFGFLEMEPDGSDAVAFEEVVGLVEGKQWLRADSR